MEDQKIIALYFDRNENAIRETKKKYGKLCFRIAKHIVGNAEDAEECENDTYLAAWNAIPPASPKSLLAFVSKIARNLALKRYEYNTAEKRFAFEPIELSELSEVLPDESMAHDTTEEELGKIISDFLEGEKEEVRNVFIRKYWFFDPTREIAERYGFTETKVKSMLFHTRNKLKHHLKMKGVHL